MIKRHKWGWGITLLSREHFKVKLLCFGRKKACSKQRHEYRSELWLMLFGKGRLTASEHEHYIGWVQMNKGSAARVNAGDWHRFTASKPSVILEIQYGEKCEESDIERL